MIQLRRNNTSSILGIELDEKRIQMVQVSQQGQEFQIVKRHQAALSINPMSSPAELVGQDIRNHLEKAGIREKRCVVCLPLHWVMTHYIAVPNLSDEDTWSFLRMQAERAFPFAVEDLSLAFSLQEAHQGQRYALIAAVLTNRIVALQNALRAAKLHPVSITLGIPTSQNEQPAKQAVRLHMKENATSLYITTGGVVAAMRALDPEEVEDQPETIARELRITLGLLPEDVRNGMRDLVIFGHADQTRPLVDEIQDSMKHLGLAVTYTNGELKGRDLNMLTLESALISHVTQKASPIEFLPPQVNRVQQLMRRVSSRSNLWMGSAATALLLIVCTTLLYQHFRLRGLESQWNAIAAHVEDVESVQTKVRAYRPWFEDSVHSLSITKTITEAFPVEGKVWLKNLEIQSLSQVICTGFAASHQDWLQMIDRLQETGQVKDLQVQQLQGENPMQFVFHFRWLEADSNG